MRVARRRPPKLSVNVASRRVVRRNLARKSARTNGRRGAARGGPYSPNHFEGDERAPSRIAPNDATFSNEGARVPFDDHLYVVRLRPPSRSD